MNEEGAQLREDNVPQLAILTGSPSNSLDLDVKLGSQGNIERTRERRLYVFDREHLDADPEEMAFHLAITEDQVLQEPELGRNSISYFAN